MRPTTGPFPARSPRTRRALRCAGALVALGLAGASAAACGSPSDASGAKLAVVAGENVWGAVAAAVGGSHVAVTSLITSPSQDPHSFTATAADAAVIAHAKVVVQDGARYDPFVGQLLAASGTSPFLVDAATILSTGGTGGPNVNPHFWYSVGRVERVARVLADVFESFDRAHKGYYEARLRAFDTQLAAVTATEATIRARFGGDAVVYTERVPGYLLAESGLRVVTPPGYARAVEQGTQPSLRDQVAMSGLLAFPRTHRHSAGRVRALLYNVQTTTPVTAQARAEAVAAGVPVVSVSETLPPGVHSFAGWLHDVASSVLAALQRG